MIGRQVRHYRIIESLGKGGMGEVYVAEDVNLDRKVALKILPPEFANDDERRERFRREAKAVAALNHPNIVTIYSVEEAEGNHFFTMEMVDGVSLTEKIPADGLSPKTFFELAIPLVDALSAAHRSGVMHRDLKPANVMITVDGRVKVLDFGLAKLREDQVNADQPTAIRSADLTEIGRVLGTAAHMSPEQAEGKPIDSRSDIFSLGILFYQMLTGKRPFQGDTQVSVISSVLKDDPPSISDLKPDLSLRLDDLIHRCLEKRPSSRFQSSDELLEGLQAAKKEFDTGELLASRSGTRSTFPGHNIDRFRKFGVLLLLLILLAASALVYTWISSSSEDPGGFTTNKRMLAVFRFENLTGKEEFDWLRDGLTDMLVTDLSQIPSLTVLSTERLRQVLGSQDSSQLQPISFDTVQEVAKQAGIGTAVLGSYLKAGEKWRINLRLQGTEEGETIDSQSFEGEGESSIFTLVDEVSRMIQGSLALASLQEEQSDRDLASVTTDSVEAYKLLVEGIKLHDQGADREAIGPLEEAIELDPGFSMALAKLSVAYGNIGDAEKEKEFAESALRHLDRLTDRERYYIEGRYYSLDPETSDRAIGSYLRAIDLFPDHDTARHNLALILIEQGRYDEAIEHLEILRRGGMVFPGTYQALADAYASIGDLERGLTVLEEYVAGHDENPAGYENLGKMLIVAGQLSKAIDILKKSESLAPKPIPYDRMSAHILVGEWEQARRLAEKTRTLGTEIPLTWVGYVIESIIDFYFGQSEDAFSLLEEAAALFEEGAGAVPVPMIRAGFALQLGKPEDARRIAEVSLDSPQGRDLKVSLLAVSAIASATLGDAQKMTKYHGEFLELLGNSPKDVRLRHLVEGMLASVRQDYDHAIAELENAGSLLPVTPSQEGDFINIWFGLGSAYWEKGDKDTASIWFHRVAEAKFERLMSPISYVRSYYFLGKYHWEQGEKELGRRYFQVFLDFWKDGQIDVDRVVEVKKLMQ